MTNNALMVLALAASDSRRLACLSKYSALFLAPGAVLWMALTPDGRRTLRTTLADMAGPE